MQKKRPKKKRLSLLERQQKLLQEKGFSKPRPKAKEKPTAQGGARTARRATAGRRNSAGHSAAFVKRQERRLLQEGRYNAAASSRRKVSMQDDDGDDDEAEEEEDEAGGAGAKSVASRASRAPSMHPSVAYSMACSETTIGAGDETGYWDYQHRVVEKKDLGHRCRECRKPFRRIGDPLTERRGARTSCGFLGCPVVRARRSVIATGVRGCRCLVPLLCDAMRCGATREMTHDVADSHLVPPLVAL